MSLPRTSTERRLALGRKFAHAIAAGLVIASAVASSLRAQNLLEQLVIPGPVVSGHAKYEKE